VTESVDRKDEERNRSWGKWKYVERPNGYRRERNSPEEHAEKY
jgi:hypothetical protein